jgi:hypothetical protein
VCVCGGTVSMSRLRYLFGDLHLISIDAQFT